MNTIDWILDGVRVFLEHHSRWSSIAGAFLLGTFVTFYSDPNVKYISEVLSAMFGIARPINILSWLALSTILAFSGVRYLLEIYVRHRSYEIRLARLYYDKIDPTLQPFHRGRVGWGVALTLQSCPNFHSGWPIEDVRIEHDSTQYLIKTDYIESYEQYLKTVSLPKRSDDRTRLMLKQNPGVFSDAPKLWLSVQETRWSQVRFYQKWIFQRPQERMQHINEVLCGPIDFPNSLCLHLVVITSDKYILRTQRSSMVDYYPNLWACALGEQLDISDLVGTEEKIASKWVTRALWEELGVSENGFDLKHIRVMALFLEGDIINCSIIALAPLKHNCLTLDAIIDKKIRTDYEFQAWDFLSWDQIPNELITPTKTYHPSNGLHLFYAGIFRFGAPGLSRRLLKLEEKS